MISLQRLKERILFWKDWYPTQTVIMRRRGERTVPEFTSSVRMKYDDAPNLHKLETGEETKAVELEAVAQDTDGTPTIFLYEAEDGQLIPWYPTFDDDDVEAHLINNLDERLNAHAAHMEKAQEKYTIPGFVHENKDMIMTVATALAVAVIFYAAGAQFGDAVPYLEALSEEVPSLADALQDVGGGGGDAPPGQ